MLFRIYKYYISTPFNKLFWFLTRISSKKKFIYFFNLFCFLNNYKERIYFKDNSFFFKNKNWTFSEQRLGFTAYAKGFKERIDSLKDNYAINNLEFKDNDVIIDIGANNGDFYLCFDKKIEYYGIEPSPTVFLNLEYNVKNQNLINKGVWSSSIKEIEFFLKDESGDSSIIPINNFIKKIKIETTTLDEIIDKINKPIKLIKIEAEGAEPEILEGFKKNLDNTKYITIDCGFERGVKQTSTIAQCSNYLINNNFEMIDFRSSRTVALYKNKNIS
jgi:FkbM family methyltransferase